MEPRRNLARLAGTPSSQVEALRSLPGFEELVPEDLIVPLIHLVQPTSQLPGSPPAGQFFHSTSGASVPSFRAVFLTYHRTRVLFDPDDLQAPTICRSGDALHPVSPLTGLTVALWAEKLLGAPLSGPPSDVNDCPGCPFGDLRWLDDEAPPCNLTYNLLGLDVDNFDAPFILPLRKTAVGPVRRLLSTIAMRRQPLFRFLVQVGVEEQADKRGKWYVPTFVVLAAVGDQDLTKYRSLHAEMRNVPLPVQDVTEE